MNAELQVGVEVAARGVFVVLGIGAVGVGAFLAIAPVSTDVSLSVLPDVVLDNYQLRLGGKVGVTISADGSSARIECGPPVAPYEIRVEDPNLLSDIIQGAERVEARISSECGSAVNERRQRAVLAAGAALVLFILAAVSRASVRFVEIQAVGPTPAAGAPSRLTPKTSGPPPLESAAISPPPGWYPDPIEADGVRWWNGADWVDSAVPSSAAVPSDVPEPSHESRMRRRVVASGLVVVTIVVAIAIVAGRSPDSVADSSTPFVDNRLAPSTTEDPQAAIERRCIAETLARADDEFDIALAMSREDLESSRINLDGDSSWRNYSAGLQVIDTSDCPADFRAAFIEYTDVWREYGEDFLAATKGPFGGSLSDDERSDYTFRVNQVRDLLEDIASDNATTVGQISFTL